jgi:hypothetical protein
MRRIGQHLSFANVVSVIALFIAISGGTAVALNGSNTVFTDDVANDTQPASGGNPAGGLVAADLRPNSVGTSEVTNGSLNDEDVGQGTFIDFEATIGNVPAQSCVNREVTGINAQGDHLLLTPNFNESDGRLTYSIEFLRLNESAFIKVCNPTATAIDDGQTPFNLLVIDAK